MATVAMQDRIVEGVRSPVRTSGGSDASEAAVFLHGNPGSSEDWLDLLAAAGDFCRTVAPDLPGFGKADRPRSFDYTVTGYARHLAGLLEELGVTKAHLVLHDFGGPWGLAWAAAHKQAVASVTLINVGILPGYRWHKFARIWRTPVLGELFQLCGTRPAFRFLLNADNPRRFPDAFVDRMFDDADWGMKRTVLRLYRATPDLGEATRLLGEALKPLDLPALVIWGDDDKYLPVSYAAEQRRYFKAEVNVMPGCGHWPMIDEPEHVRDLVIPFLRRQLAK